MNKRTNTHSLTKLELLILQFLHWKEPLYAYEIEKMIERLHAREWLDIGFSTIYSVLKRLHNKGLVVKEKQSQGNKPPRILYKKTSSGNQILKDEVAQTLHSLELPKTDYNQALLAIDLFEKEEVLASSQTRLENCQEALDVMRDMQNEYEGQEYAEIAQLIVLRNIRFVEAEIVWLKEWMEVIQATDFDDMEKRNRASLEYLRTLLGK